MQDIFRMCTSIKKNYIYMKNSISIIRKSTGCSGMS